MPSPKENEAQVQAATLAWVAAFNECSASNAAALYAPDAVLWGTMSQAIISTPEGIRQYFERACAAVPPPKVMLGEQLVQTHEGFAVSSGTYTFSVTAQGQSRSLPARFTFTYQKAGRGWLVVSHHSSLMPVAQQPASSPGE